MALQEELQKRVSGSEEQCRQRIEKMERTVKNRRGELQAAVDAKLQEIAEKIREGQERVRAEETIVRKEWERMICEKVQKELGRKRSESIQTGKVRQENGVLQVVGRLERENREELGSIGQRIEKENREHAVCVARLKRRLDEVAREVCELRGEAQDERLDREIEELRAAVERCRCQENEQELRTVGHQRAIIEDELVRIRMERNAVEKPPPELEGVKTRVANAELERERLRSEIVELENEIRSRKSRTNVEVAELEQSHKEQIAAIGERVKQTVAKKDQVIEQLKTKLRECGLLNGP
jgi:chromosome segregation ATPase